MNDDSEQQVERRSFVRAGAALAAFVIPGWTAACRRAEESSTSAVRLPTTSAPEPAAEADPIADLLAKSDARDVLVLRVDDDAARARDLGLVVAGLLTDCEDAHLAPLAAVDIACVTSDEFRLLAPEFAGRPDVRAVLVRHDRSVRVAVQGTTPPIPIGLDKSTENERWFHHAIAERSAWFAGQAAEAIGVDAVALERAAAAERSRVPGWPAAAEPTCSNAQRWPCNSKLAALRDPGRRAHWDVVLARAVRERWGEGTPPRGSAWAVAASCGSGWTAPSPPSPRREDRDRRFVLCGIGHTPVLSARFLHFYSREELGS